MRLTAQEVLAVMVSRREDLRSGPADIATSATFVVRGSTCLARSGGADDGDSSPSGHVG